VIADGDADVHLHGCHVENPGDTTGGYRMLRVEDGLGRHGASITASATHFVLSNGGSVFGRSPFFVAGTCVEGGLTLTDCRLPQDGHFRPEVHETHRRWVAGEGRAVASGTRGNENFNGAPFSAWMNLLYNTDAEAGDTTGWVTSGSGSFVVTTAPGTFRSGSRGFRIVVSSGQSRTVYQDFPVRPGQKIAVGHWIKTTKTGDGAISTGVNFYGYPGGPQVGWTVGWDNNAANPGSLRNIGAVVPPRVTVARLIFQAWSSSSGTAELYFDDVIANAI